MADLHTATSSHNTSEIIELTSRVRELEQRYHLAEQSEQKYRFIFECAAVAMLIMEENTSISMVNRCMEQMTGYTKDEIASRWTEVVVPEDLPKILQYHRQRREDPSNVPVEYEFRIINKLGQVRTFFAYVSMIPGSRKSLVSLIDITERKKIETALRESEHRFKEIADLLPGIICEMDLNLTLTYVNKTGLRKFGFEPEDFLRGINVNDFIPPDFREKIQLDMANIFSGDYGNPQIYKMYTKSGDLIDIIVNSAPIVQENKIVGIRTCIVDITEWMIVEKKFMESEERFRTIYNESPLGIALVSVDGACIDSNPSFRKIFSTQNSHISLYDLIELTDDQRAQLKTGSGITCESVIDGNSKPCYYEWHIKPLTSSFNGAPIYLVQVQDVTEMKEVQELKLQRAREATEKAEALVAGLRKELVEKATFHNMVSRSTQMKSIFDLLPEISFATAAVLITGESGTGKELIAKSLHELGPRSKKPFVAINCSALPDNLLESELFGYKAGAFTDAKKDKPGKFALAEGGTIFLDEIGDISSAMQVKLLRVLQEKYYEPLGATSSVKADVRVVAATNRDLGTMIRNGEFREDLFYRINVVTLTLPSLRERRTDVPLLCEFFIEKFNSRYGKTIKGIDAEALEILMQYDFPGNIRELENSIEHAFIFCKDTMIAREHLPAAICPSRKLIDATLSGVQGFEDLERLYLSTILKESNGSKTVAAQRLGIHKTTLFRKMKQLNM